MTYSEFQKNYIDIREAVIDKRLRDALQIMSRLLVQVSTADIHNRYQSLSDTFRSMLKYSFEFSPDPERNKIFNKLQRSILELSDDIRENWYRNMDLFERKAIMEKVALIESRYMQVGLQIAERLILTGVREDERSLRDELAAQLFCYFLQREEMTEEAKKLFIQIIEHEDIDTDIKGLIISGLTMSQLRHFDSNKIIMLFDLSAYDDVLLRQRAMIGLFLTIIAAPKRILLYEEVVQRLRSIPDDQRFQERMLGILIQFIRASETDKVTRKIQEEIVPEVLKMRSELEEKLNLDELLSKENFEEKNPEWENFFKDSPDVYQKLEQFSKMQIEGADVFMGAFAMLKHFPFFRDMPNWFIPFTASNPEVIKAFKGVNEGVDLPVFLEGLEQSTVLCNSDKFSFCLNIQHLPSQQSKMMIELFNMELKAMNEMMEDEFKLNTESKNKIVNTQYIQDLYRFFKLYPYRKEYPGIFETEINVLEDKILSIIYSEPKVIRNLAEFYFAKDHYQEASELFSWLSRKEQSFELFEKLGFCAQKMNDFEKAIHYYKQAELFEKDKIWLQKKLGYCYRKTGNFKKAIEYYQQIIKSEPKDLNNLAYLGQLHIDTENFEEALKFYYKVEYEDPDNPRVFRPIGWCSFVLGKYDTAIKYFGKVIKQKSLKSDYMNIGHCYWVLGKIEQALDSYREAVRVSGNDLQWFRSAFLDDSRYLKNAGLKELDIVLMMDYVILG